MLNDALEYMKPDQNSYFKSYLSLVFIIARTKTEFSIGTLELLFMWAKYHFNASLSYSEARSRLYCA